MKLRKIIISAALFLSLAGCASASSAKPDTAQPASETDTVGSEEAAASEEPADASEETVAEPAVHWVHKPDLLLSDVSELVTFPYFFTSLTTINEQTGYPQEWDDTWKLAEIYQSPDRYCTPPCGDYDTDAVWAVYNSYLGIYDYNGNAVTKPFMPYPDNTEPVRLMYSPALGFSFIINDPDFVSGVFSQDFRSIVPKNPAGIGGDPGLGYFLLNGTLMNGFSLEDAKPVSAIDELNGHNCFVKIAVKSDNPYFPDITGYAAFDSTGKLRKKFDGLFPINYVNGFTAMGSKNEYIPATGEHEYGPIMMVNMNTLEPITEAVYEDAKWFENGFCPVKKNGKWGFIDETGTEVTDFIWDDVTSAYEGKVYVGISGVYGVLDLAGTVSEGIPVTMETCYPAGVPEGIAPETGEIPDPSIGRLQINVDNLNTRADHSTEAEKRGIISSNEVFPVYETFKDADYTWYRIDESTWLADKDGSWVTFTPKN